VYPRTTDTLSKTKAAFRQHRRMARPRLRRGGSAAGGSPRLPLWWSPLACLLVCGCATEKPAQPPPDMPAAFEHAASATGSAWPAQDWYRSFGSEELDTLVELAVANNGGLVAARERVAQADAHARQAGAALLPSVDANGNASYLAGHSSQGGGHELDWFAMLSASYEVDFWGKNRALAHAAQLEAHASRAERDTVALTLLGAVAEQYFQLLALRERIALARANVTAARELLEVVQARFDAGVASPVALATQHAALDTARITLADLEQGEVQARVALALLLGRAPEHFNVTGHSLDPLQEPAVAADIPAQLLTRRPDLAAAEANLRAARANVTAARAAMLPDLSLTASGGVQNPALPGTVLTIPGVGPSLALTANLTQPIFDHGRLQAQRDETAARERELLAAYRTAVLAALGDVEKALSSLQHLDDVADSQRDNLTSSERAFEGARLRYEKGSGDFLTLLEAQRTVYATRDEFTQYRLARFQALIGLCKALGGGWSGASVPQPQPSLSWSERR
jgi:NodT family efflux transporter outer membrane factor (OMF) lipoprotein